MRANYRYQLHQTISLRGVVKIVILNTSVDVTHRPTTDNFMESDKYPTNLDFICSAHLKFVMNGSFRLKLDKLACYLNGTIF